MARHESGDARAAAALLERLEAFRGRLAPVFAEVPDGVSVVMHPSAIQLSLSRPWLPLARLATVPAARRYLAGWFGPDEIHVLGPAALESRASAVPGSREALALSAEHEYAHLVVAANNPGLPPPFTGATLREYVRWAWHCEGAATFLSGQVRHLRPALARRLREGKQPSFPPSPRDAQLLGGTVFSLLEEGAGHDACVDLATSLHPAGPVAAIERAFARERSEVERDWRDHLGALAAAGARVMRDARGRSSAAELPAAVR
jgi:hypothetical protein